MLETPEFPDSFTAAVLKPESQYSVLTGNSSQNWRRLRENIEIDDIISYLICHGWTSLSLVQFSFILFKLSKVIFRNVKGYLDKKYNSN